MGTKQTRVAQPWCPAGKAALPLYETLSQHPPTQPPPAPSPPSGKEIMPPPPPLEGLSPKNHNVLRLLSCFLALYCQQMGMQEEIKMKHARSPLMSLRCTPHLQAHW